MKRRNFLILIGLLFTITLSAQKRVMNFDDFDSWNRITSTVISDNGKYTAVQLTPWRGDSKVELYEVASGKKTLFNMAQNPLFSSDSKFVVFVEKPALKQSEDLKLKKTKKENMPSDKLFIYNIADNKSEVVNKFSSFKLSNKNGEWVAYQKTKNDTLFLRTLDRKQQAAFANVSEYYFAKDAAVLLFAMNPKGAAGSLSLFNMATMKQDKIFESDLALKQLTISDNGSQVAFLGADKKDNTQNNYTLYYSKDHKEAVKAISSKSEGMVKDWVVNGYARLSFSKDGGMLFFGTSPAHRQKDSTILAENRPNVHVWNWDESKQYTQQDVDKEKDLKKSYQASLNTSSMKMIQLSTIEIPDVRINRESGNTIALAASNVPYAIESMWEGRSRSDYYIMDIATGSKELLKKGIWSRISLSPAGNYAYWYNERDSSWYSYSIKDKKEYKLTSPNKFIAYDDMNDVPDYPSSQGVAGWSKDDAEIFINDKHDIWSFSPRSDREPINITKNGKQNGIVYRLTKLDSEISYIDIKKNQVVTGFNTKSKGNGFYTISFDGKGSPKMLLAGDYMLSNLQKAKSNDTYIFNKETFEEFGNLWTADAGFKKISKLTDANPQQKDVIWGKSELVSWMSLDGKKLEGVVYYPENFDPSKKYPLLVSFYDRNSDNLYSHRTPEPHRSTADYHFYTSNGYIIFNPDIVYTDGYPGQSAYNCIMPGISSLVSKGFIDEKKIGAQGHSWGGYQVAYLATRTDLFAAIESGAPVVNMLSAYGGIRWATGLNRSMQYEHQQSRIGGTIWEKPLQYIENSPLFFLDKVKTPILIMSNDQDGHVPWWQGIEYFVALKRLGKPTWMLNYTGEPHWPQKYPNKVDFQKRMFGFFEHYLNGKPMPAWMKEGVKAVDRDFDLGY